MSKAKRVDAHVNKDNGNINLSIQEHKTDFPLIPIQAIEKLYEIKPQRAEWAFDQMEKEANYRRSLDEKTNDRQFFLAVFKYIIYVILIILFTIIVIVFIFKMFGVRSYFSLGFFGIVFGALTLISKNFFNK